MQIAFVLSLLAAIAAAAPAVDLQERGNLPGLDSTQSTNARNVISEVKKEKVGKQGCLASIATALTESSILIYANKDVPESMKYHHDAVGSDHDSIGIFQQRASIYKNVADDMNAAKSAGLFIQGMKAVHGWETMNVGKLCQDVQRSAYPDRYEKNVPAAEKICGAEGL
jgi:hypothetical protein